MKLSIIFLFVIFFVNPIKAVEPTPESENKTKEIVNIVKQIVNNNVTPTPVSSKKPKSFFGNITQIDENIITINFKSQTQLIRINDKTAYIDLKRNKSKLINFKVGQEILAMGYLQEDQSLDGKRIVAIELKSFVNNHQTITGQIVDISQEASIFTLTPNYNKNSPFQLKTDSKTKIVNLSNKTVASSQAIANGKKIIAIIKPDSKLAKTFYTSKIIVLDSPATKSVTSTPTPSPKP